MVKESADEMKRQLKLRITRAISMKCKIMWLTCAVAWRIFTKSSFISSTACSKIFSGSSKELRIAFA